MRPTSSGDSRVLALISKRSISKRGAGMTAAGAWARALEPAPASTEAASRTTAHRVNVITPIPVVLLLTSQFLL